MTATQRAVLGAIAALTTAEQAACAKRWVPGGYLWKTWGAEAAEKSLAATITVSAEDVRRHLGLRAKPPRPSRSTRRNSRLRPGSARPMCWRREPSGSTRGLILPQRSCE